MKNNKAEFYCDKCGLCCQNLNMSHLYDDLNDGTGICIYYDKNSKLCSIYENRPEKCNIEKMYCHFQEDIAWDAYVELNAKSCEKLKELNEICQIHG